MRSSAQCWPWKGEQATLEWLKAMKANFVAYKGNSTVMKAVNAGQIDGGVICHYYRFVDQSKTGETAKTLAHYFKHQIGRLLLASPAAACWRPANTKRRHRPSLNTSPAKKGRRACTNNAFEYAWWA